MVKFFKKSLERKILLLVSGVLFSILSITTVINIVSQEHILMAQLHDHSQTLEEIIKTAQQSAARVNEISNATQQTAYKLRKNSQGN